MYSTEVVNGISAVPVACTDRAGSISSAPVMSAPIEIPPGGERHESYSISLLIQLGRETVARYRLVLGA